MAASVAGKRCYYEVLGLKPDCTGAEITAAYRRLARTLHPDKLPPSSSPAAVADATAAFQELSHAHSVLSDAHERAYYDSHRSQILFADTFANNSNGTNSRGSSNVTHIVDELFSYFQSSAFSGYSDTGRGFYKVYGDVFNKVYNHEVMFVKKMGRAGDNSLKLPPAIGNLDSPYEQVTAFYGYWLGFSTVMDFAWVAEYDAAMGPNRRSRRLMEEENAKLMKKAKREYNDAVRGLAAFAKKRDKRVVDMAVRKRAEEEQRKLEQKKRKEEEARRRKERVMAYEEQEWAEVEDEGEFVDDDWDEGEEKGKKKEELYCVVCNKKFKSDKQWKNHEQSKKHREKVAELRIEFEEEDETIKEGKKGKEENVGGEWEEVTVGFEYEPEQESAESSEWVDATEELVEDLRDGLELGEEEEVGDEELGKGDQEGNDEVSVLEAMLSGRKNWATTDVSEDQTSLGDANDADDDKQIPAAPQNAGKKGRRKGASKKAADDESGDVELTGEKSEVQSEEIELDKQVQDAGDKMEGSFSLNEEVHVKAKAEQRSGKKKKNKMDKRESGKKDTASDQTNSSKGRKQKDISNAPSNSCETCGEIFESRNNLFTHLGDTGHAMLKTRHKKR